MKDWELAYDGFDPKQERLREALCTLGNGYFATRGAAPEAEADAIHYPGTYLNGGYNRLRTHIAGQVIENEDLINLPNWLPLSFCLPDGNWFNLQAVEILSYVRVLDLRRGVLSRTLRWRDKLGRETRLTQERLVHMGQPHLAALQTTLVAENWSGEIRVRSALDGRVINAGVERYQALDGKHLVAVEENIMEPGLLFLKVRTTQSGIEIAESATTVVFRDGALLVLPKDVVQEPGYIAHEFAVDISESDELTIEKVVALFTSRDQAISECGSAAQNAIARCDRFGDLLASHIRAWAHLWNRFDIAIELNGEARNNTALILRLHLFHLLQTVSPHTMDMDVGVPARGLHGEAYRGHIFWDELFIFPFLNLRVPEITRSLLKYRYRRLSEARAAARREGYRGAMFPWQSGSDGREESQRLHLNPKSGRWIPDHTHLQRHVNAAIAYNIWQYFQATRDMEFISFVGAEIILEIARFWASIAKFNPNLDRYEILGVMGPDEYHDSLPGADHPGLNNNAYTNLMAVWVLCRAADVLEILPAERRRELRENLALTAEELSHWDEISHKMRLVFHSNGVLSQFEDYESLEELDWRHYQEKYGNIQRLDRILEAEGDSPNRYKVSKQADVLMLFYLFSSEELRALFERLGYRFHYETIPQNISYYIKRTSHGSTLSRIIHSWVLARSDRERSWELLTEALKSDVEDVQGGTTAEGIHLGAMAATVDMIQRGYTGIELRGDVLWFNPSLPKPLAKLRLQIRYRGHCLDLEMAHAKLKVSAVQCAEEAIKLGFGDKIFQLRPQQSMEFAL